MLVHVKDAQEYGHHMVMVFPHQNVLYTSSYYHPLWKFHKNTNTVTIPIHKELMEINTLPSTHCNIYIKYIEDE